jgi:hypothetical protein
VDAISLVTHYGSGRGFRDIDSANVSAASRNNRSGYSGNHDSKYPDSIGKLPGVNELPVLKEMPDVMVTNNGTPVTTPRQWRKRREEMKKILQYYAVGRMPPPPGNVKGKVILSVGYH